MNRELAVPKQRAEMSSNSSFIDAENVSKVGIGYGIAIAVGILILVSTIILASYLCVRVQGRGHMNGNGMANSATVVPHSYSSSVNEETTINIGEISYSGEWSSPYMGAGSGLDQKTIDSYPKMVFSRHQKLPRTCRNTWCSICLGEYKYKEVLRLMPDCRHCFHASCIDAWLKLNASCPLCRTSPLPSPLPTPLSELVPLAR